MKRLKILICAENDSQLVNNTWFVSLANIITSDERVDLTILTVDELAKEEKLIFNDFARIKWLSIDNQEVKSNVKIISDEIALLDTVVNYHVVILAGRTLIEHAFNKAYTHKSIPYIEASDFFRMNYIDKSYYKNVHDAFPFHFVSTENMKRRLKKVINFPSSKTIAIEYVEESKKTLLFKNSNFAVSTHFGISKRHRIYQTVKWQHMFKKIDKDVSWNVIDCSKENDCLTDIFDGHIVNVWNDMDAAINASDIGLIYENLNQHATWIYFLSLASKGKAIILKRNRKYEALLGADYPLFTSNLRDVNEKIRIAMNDQTVYKQAAKRCYDISRAYQYSNVRGQILSILWKFNPVPETILFVGHDFKFIHWYMEHCRNKKYTLLIDKWRGHAGHDEEVSLALLKQADIIFCEWGLDNARFYSQHKLPGQKLFIRLHRQELEKNYLDKVKFSNVTNVITVSPQMMEEFARIKKVPRNKIKLIPNMVDTNRYKIPKKDESKFHLGIIGILPRLKRLDRAIEIFEKLWEVDTRYKLFIKGKMPHELPWMKSRKEDLAYYEALFHKIESSPWKNNVVFDGHGNDVAEWLTNIGYILSTSDVEGFHLAAMEGIASGAIPVIFNWPGARMIYPKDRIVQNVDEAVHLILKINETRNTIEQRNDSSLPEKYNKKNITGELDKLIFGV